ncbi:phosphatidylethanolamine-binding protein homolog F40A3.3 isoform X3 [Bemisia tabaci]|uniref:phosphatidylethanolamine-binding protein homolog F40A3.3 isoform X3 n=1 Tax=Bemisia tabaci TaxID=7038 RepID=UPI003B282072
MHNNSSTGWRESAFYFGDYLITLCGMIFMINCGKDPDSPSRSDPRLSELQHWIIGNVYRRNISSGETFAEYTGPRDAREFVVEEGIHRYIISVFEQIGKHGFAERRIPREPFGDPGWVYYSS